jgi:hypothetical protein
VLIYDEEFSELLRPLNQDQKRFIAWCRPGGHARDLLLEDLIAREGIVALEPSRERGCGTVMLASQHPASPSSPCRKLVNSLVTPGAVSSKIPLRPREATLIAAPMSGSWGFLHFALGLRLASTLVLRRNFDPIEALAAADRHDVTALAVLPEMLERIMELPARTMECFRHTLRVIAVQGPAVPSEVAIPAMERFGDVLYSLHGPMVVRLAGDWPSHTRRSGEPAPVVELRLSGRVRGEQTARRESQR